MTTAIPEQFPGTSNTPSQPTAHSGGSEYTKPSFGNPLIAEGAPRPAPVVTHHKCSSGVGRLHQKSSSLPSLSSSPTKRFVPGEFYSTIRKQDRSGPSSQIPSPRNRIAPTLTKDLEAMAARDSRSQNHLKTSQLLRPQYIWNQQNHFGLQEYPFRNQSPRRNTRTSSPCRNTGPLPT